MTHLCPSCRQAVPADHAVVLAEQIERMTDWERLAKLAVGAHVTVIGVGSIYLRKLETQWDASYGDMMWTPIHMILQIGERFFKKTGDCDSYSEQRWNGSFVEVFPRQEIITRYEEKK